MEVSWLKQAASRVPFAHFGNTAFTSKPLPLTQIDVSGDAAGIRRKIRQYCPEQPGVYGMVNRDDELVYVGMSRRLQGRLLTYFTRTSPDAKETFVAHQAHRLVWEVGEHELTVQLRELELIRRWRPRLNIRGLRERTQVGVLYLTQDDTPCFRVGTTVPPDTPDSWGPVRLTRRLDQAVASLNALFRLRDCPDDNRFHFSDESPRADGRDCLRSALGTCLAPCTGSCRRSDYQAQVDGARAWLRGQPSATVHQLEQAMRRAGQQQQFEQAARLRDQWNALSYLSSQLERLQDARKQTWFIYPVTSTAGTPLWILLAAGRVVSVLPEPRTPDDATRHLEILEKVYYEAEPVTDARNFDYIDMVSNWFRGRPAERARVLSPSVARQRCHQLKNDSHAQLQATS